MFEFLAIDLQAKMENIVRDTELFIQSMKKPGVLMNTHYIPIFPLYLSHTDKSHQL